MRLWLENLKESLPSDSDANSHQAAASAGPKRSTGWIPVVKRFLDFHASDEVKLEQTQLSRLLREVLEVARPQLQKANVEVVQSLPTDVPEVFVGPRPAQAGRTESSYSTPWKRCRRAGQIRLELTRRRKMAKFRFADTERGIRARKPAKDFSNFSLQPGPAAAESD